MPPGRIHASPGAGPPSGRCRPANTTAPAAPRRRPRRRPPSQIPDPTTPPTPPPRAARSVPRPAPFGAASGCDRGRHVVPTRGSLNFSRDLFGSDVVRAGRRVGLIVPDGYGRSAGVARGRAFHGRWGPRVGWRVSCCSGKGGPKSLPSFGYRGGPAPGGVDAYADLAGAAGDAGGDVQDPVAEGVDLAGGQIAAAR